MTEELRHDMAILGPDKPFWITEWGLNAHEFPNKHGQTRAEAIKEYYSVLDQLRVPLGPTFYYDYSGQEDLALTDSSGALLPGASTVTAR